MICIKKFDGQRQTSQDVRFSQHDFFLLLVLMPGGPDPNRSYPQKHHKQNHFDHNINQKTDPMFHGMGVIVILAKLLLP